jgi:D-alanyl-D-alanine dipeptidase
VAGQPHHRLFEEAARAFERMAQVASYDSVELKILDSYRSPATAEANAAASGNPQAVAKFSSHTLGLAVDLQMSTATQRFLETTTHPMSNVAGMRAAEAHKWMVMRGAKFGWFPFGNEPWHWEYNPPGFRDRFRQVVDPPKAPAGAATN